MVKSDLLLLSLMISLLITFFICAGTALESSFAEELPPTANWRRDLGVGKEKVTKLHFFFHDKFGGNNRSSVIIAQPAIAKTLPTFFGTTFLADDWLTVGPEWESKEIGRALGMYGSAGQGRFSFFMAMNFCFTDGKYQGSCLSMLSQNFSKLPKRELAIVGGTGVFRLARGVAMANTITFTSDYVVVEYHITVLHYR